MLKLVGYVMILCVGLSLQKGCGFELWSNAWWYFLVINSYMSVVCCGVVNYFVRD